MGTKRIGLARVEALLENLKRDLDLSGSKIILDGASDNVCRQAGRSPDRYYLTEYFQRKPGVNGDIASSTEGTREIANPDFELEGTSAVSTCTDFGTTYPGTKITTTTSDADQCIIRPHEDTDQSAWATCKWPTHGQVEWECSITLSQIDNLKVWAGLKLTTDQLGATDDDQIFFKAATDATAGENLATSNQAAMAVAGTNMQWHVVYSIAGVDYTTNLGLAVAADTTYHLKISLDSDRTAAVYINGTQYGLVNDKGHTGGNSGTVAAGWGQTDTLINGSSAGSTSTAEIAITVDGTDARKVFKAEDYIYVSGTSVPTGQVKSVDSATQITLHSLDATMADGVELFNFGNAAYDSKQRSKALTTNIDLVPCVGIENGDGNAAIMFLHFMAISRTISDG